MFKTKIMLDSSTNLKDRFPITDSVRLECVLREIQRHGYPDGNGKGSPDQLQPLDPHSEFYVRYITPDKIRILFHHSSSQKISYVNFHGEDPEAVRLLEEAFFYSLDRNFSFRQKPLG